MLKLFSNRRKRLRVLVLAILGTLLALAALPWWLPWVGRPLVKRAGVTWNSYARHGYQRFELRGVSFDNRAGRFQAERVEAYVPTVWLWRCWFGSRPEPFARVQTWSWQSVLADHPKPATQPGAGVHEILTAAAILQRWLPKAELSDGTIRLDDRMVTVPQATWSDGKLSATVAVPPITAPFTLEAALPREGPGRLRLNFDELDLQLDATLYESGGGATLDGTVAWLSNRLELKAVFPAHGFQPESASVRADAFRIPARLLRLEDYEDLAGALSADWSTNRFALTLTAKALARPLTGLPPIDLEARGSGDATGMQIDQATLSAPWLQAELSGPTKLFFQPPFLPESVALILAADLDQQPWLAARGKLAGQAVLHPSLGRFPQVDFTLSGSDVVVSNVATRSAELAGGFLWPQIQLTQASIEMADGSTVSVRGQFDLHNQTIADGRLEYMGSYGRDFLPAGISFGSAALSAQFSGPLRALTNSASLSVEDLAFPHARPLRLDATWIGQGLRFREFQLALAAGNSTLQMRGSADLAGGAKALEVTGLELDISNRMELQLQEPFQLHWQPGDAAGAAPSLELQPVICLGEGRQLWLGANLNWPGQGSMCVAATGLDAGLIQDFVPRQLPMLRMNQLDFAAGWTNGPMAFLLQTQAGLIATNLARFAADVAVAGGAGGTTIERFSISSATQTVCRVQGSLPLLFEPAQTNGWVRIIPGAPLHLHLATETNTVLWDALAALSGVRLQQPVLAADLDGTWAAPEGHLTLQAQRLEFPSLKRPLPALQSIDLALEMNRETARLQRGRFSVAGQPVQLTAELPLGQEFWPDRDRALQWPDWHKGTAELKIENAQLASFASFLPAILSPAGQARIHLKLAPGASLTGEVAVSGAATRPLGDVGAVRNIQAEMVFAGQAVQLKTLAAEIGGQRVTAWGGAELNESLWQSPQLPPFELHLRGTNLPLVRKPGLVLRADLDLSATNTPAAPPVITGRVTLRNSLFLADLKSLVPERSAAPAQRPPYFSVETPPWADWRLQVDVLGEGFMRVQTPLFEGRLSTNLKLTHTLKDPLALGEVRIQSGSVTLPFGSLAVKQGFVSLTSRDPYHPQIDVTAAAERYGYDIKMSATGPADAPVVQFSSIPPLNSEQIILMLTTGQLPRGTGATSTAGQRAQGVGLFIGQNLLSSLGLVSPDEGRLTFRSGEQVSETGQTTYEVEYGLSDNVSLIGGYDRFDQYNLNLKWRVYSK